MKTHFENVAFSEAQSFLAYLTKIWVLLLFLLLLRATAFICEIKTDSTILLRTDITWWDFIDVIHRRNYMFMRSNVSKLHPKSAESKRLLAPDNWHGVLMGKCAGRSVPYNCFVRRLHNLFYSNCFRNERMWHWFSYLAESNKTDHIRFSRAGMTGASCVPPFPFYFLLIFFIYTNI